MVEDYPPSYIVQIKRQKRWIRGDWQLLPWLVWPGRFGVKFSAIDRWKMLDNLLRAMLAPALLLIFFLGIISMPHLARMWLGIVLLSLGIPVLTGMARSSLQSLRGDKASAAFYPTRWSLARWLIAVAFLPYEAYSALDAILTTLYRLFISRRYLLQWTTAAQTAHLLGLEAHRNNTRLKLIVFSLLTWVLVGGIQLAHSLTNNGISPALLVIWPALVLWTSSPLIDYLLNQPVEHKALPLTEDQIALFRQVARRTWGFFERFVGPEDHWLPPDHFQESPAGIIAHHTSPSNIGLLLTSTLGAYDLGYLDQLGLATRLSTTLDTLDQLERYRGHFFNWYDTVSLRPLNPRYVSTVDSGNLAACLIIIAQASRELPRQRVFRWELWQGYLDTLTNLNEILAGMPKTKTQLDGKAEEIDRRITEMNDQILALRSDTSRWYAHFQTVTKEFWPDLSNHLIDVIKTGRTAFTLESLRRLQEAAAHVERHHQAIQQTLAELTPWIPLLEQPPELFEHPRFSQGMNTLRENLPYNPSLERIDACVEASLTNIGLLRSQLADAHLGQGDLLSGVQKWLDAMDQALTQARTNAATLLEKFSQITIRSERFINEMDFRFLYHPQRRVFHNGYNLDAGQLDNNYYDLLASEARIASIVAIAKGDAPQSHWLQLSRPLTKVEGGFVLLSWSATMFEYLMPPLFLHSYPGTLLADSAQGAVLRQIAYGKEKNVPWGISEAGFYRFDTNLNYQYRAFGVPGLGFKRGLGDDLVIAPYASLMAVGYDAHAVAENLVDLIEHNSFGLYGLYESIDFTSNRLDIGDISEVVQEYMSHHQGMILMSLVNYFHNDIMVQRMHADPRIQSVELLLQEQVPQAAPLQNPSADDAKGIQRVTSGPAVIQPWSVPVTTAIPQVNLLSNGSYSVLLSNMGCGYSTWKGTDLTRWQADGVLDPWGSWVYIQDLTPATDVDAPKEKDVWSVGFQPIPPDNPADVQVTYFGHMSVFRRTESGITSTMEVTVCPDDPVEIRRIHLHNMHNRLRHLRLTSYGEVVLNQQATDTRHPAFNKLFIESEFIPALNLQIFKRRPRSDEETPIFLAHMLVQAPRNGLERLDGRRIGNLAVRHEADRNRFIGRGRTFRNPAALFTKQYLSGTSGATLDPIFCLGQEVDLYPHETAEFAFLTFAGESREDVLALARRYFTWSLIDHSFHQADMATQAWLGNQNYDSSTFKDTLQVLSALLYPFKAVRAAPETLTANRLGQPGLWPFGISGDYPIMLIELDDSKEIELVQQVLQMYEFLRSRRFMADVVILNRQRTDYGAELNGIIYRLITRLKFDQWLNKRGGIFILYMDQIKPDEYTLLQTAARFIFTGSRGLLDKQMPQYPLQVHHLPEFTPTRSGGAIPVTKDPLPAIEPLQFANGYGGFSVSGREYVIEFIPGKPTPAPWINVIGYPHFGFMVSESGSQSTWAINSGENRLTPWSNDPVSDPTGEALYLRDEETGDVWTPTPLPAGDGQPYRVTHGAGYTIFEHHSHGLHQRLTLFASPEDPVKIIHLRVKNVWNHPRRITATQYIEWVLGTTHGASMQYIVPEYYEAESCLLATNPASVEFAERAAFLIACKQVHGLTADRTEFLGRGGNPASPAALRRLGLETRLTPGEDPCAVLQLHLDLLPGATEEIYFVLGEGNNKEHALELARKYHTPAFVGAALERTRAFWDHLLDAVKVHTPDPAADLLLNRWLLYQSLSCRVWGRSAFYQPSGAFGFRDQLQDILGAVHSDPAISRGQILNAARRQFTEGDVLHWWHPPSGRGVRTRISDNLLWLPYVTALYIEATGDQGILDEKVPFLDAPPLKKEEHERYNQYPETRESYSLLDHCQRALQKGMTTGPNGLPLISAGDWNDGLNRVGIEGKGESIWLAWFLCETLNRFAEICDLRGDSLTAQNYRDRAKKYAAAVEQSAWDGAWYRRAYFDDGAPLGSSQDTECQIDAIAQSWAVLSGMADPEHSHQAMQSVLDKLVLPEDQLSLLFTPPFDKSERDPGYIKGYLPGIRENGGQYTHAAIWTAWAFAHLGDGKQAGTLFDMLNPIFHSDSQEKADEYRVEPYVMCADIYSREPYLRRGGWTWYTGSASWMYRLGIEAILGIKRMGNKLKIDPCIPPEWPGFEISYRFGNSRYEISVENPHNVAKGIQEVLLDGDLQTDGLIPLADDGQIHKVKVVLNTLLAA
jgi:cyclic beta-1,2-glucan synthetase